MGEMESMPEDDSKVDAIFFFVTPQNKLQLFFPPKVFRKELVQLSLFSFLILGQIAMSTIIFAATMMFT